jgi:RNA polymerase sigma-70 factor (ECF subfamily)
LDPALTRTIEEEAIRRCQQGDKESFRRIVDLHGDHLYRTALLITRDASLAEEAVQDTLLQSWKKIRTFHPDRPFRPWINRVLINCIGIVQRRKRLPTAPIEEAFSVSDTVLGPEDSALNGETRRMLRAALESLSVEHRTVLVLRYFNDLTVQEIADSTGWRLGTVKSRLSRATAALRDVVVVASQSTYGGRLAGEESKS